MARRKPTTVATNVPIKVETERSLAEVAREVEATVKKSTSWAEKVRPVAEVEIERLRALVEDLRISVMSVIAPPKVDGKAIPRCRCGDFATQTRVLTCRINGTHRQDTCDACEFASPLIGLAGVQLLTPEPLPPAFADEARRQNAARARVREVPR